MVTPVKNYLKAYINVSCSCLIFLSFFILFDCYTQDSSRDQILCYNSPQIENLMFFLFFNFEVFLKLFINFCGSGEKFPNLRVLSTPFLKFNLGQKWKIKQNHFQKYGSFFKVKKAKYKFSENHRHNILNVCNILEKFKFV